jgi:hypothetical protein
MDPITQKPVALRLDRRKSARADRARPVQVRSRSHTLGCVK